MADELYNDALAKLGGNATEAQKAQIRKILDLRINGTKQQDPAATNSSTYNLPDVPEQVSSEPLTQPAAPITDPNQPNENFKPGGKVGMAGEPLPTIKLADGTTWMASMFDQYGKPYWGDIDPDPKFWDEVGNAFKNWWGGVRYDFQDKDTTQEQVVQKENWEDVPESFKAAGEAVTDKKGTFIEDATTVGKAVLPVMGEALGTAGRAWTNAEKATIPYGLGYLMKAIKATASGAMEVLSNVAYGAERLLGSLVISAKNQDATWNEAWAASRIAYSSFIHKGRAAEYIRRYRAGENPILLYQELQDPMVELIGQSILDPLTYFSAGATAIAKGAAKGVVAVDKMADALKVYKAVDTATDVAETIDKTVDVVKTADKIADTAKTADKFGDLTKAEIAAKEAETLATVEKRMGELHEAKKAAVTALENAKSTNTGIDEAEKALKDINKELSGLHKDKGRLTKNIKANTPVDEVVEQADNIPPSQAVKAAAETVVEDGSKVVSKSDKTLDAARGMQAAVKERVADISSTMVKNAKQRTIFSRNAAALKAILSDNMHDTFTLLKRHSKSPREFAETFYGMLRLVSGKMDDAEEIALVAKLGKHEAAEVLFGDKSLQSFIGYAQMFGDGKGGINSKTVNILTDILKEAQKSPEPLTVLTKKLTPMIEKAAEDIYPSILTQANDIKAINKILGEGTDIAKLPAKAQKYIVDGKVTELNESMVRALQIHEYLQKNFIGPVNRMFAWMYMGISPAFVARNFFTNMFHVGVDTMDLTHPFGGFKYAGKRADRVLAKWGVPAMANVGLHGGGLQNTVEAGKKKGFFEKFSTQKWNEMVEKASGKMVLAKTMDTEMPKFLKIARKDLDPILSKGGFSTEQIDAIGRACYDNGGDVWKAIDEVLTGKRVGLEDLDLSIEEIDDLVKIDADDVVLDIVRRNSDNPERMKAELQQMIKERTNLADRANRQEIPLGADQSTEVAQEAARWKQAGLADENIPSPELDRFSRRNWLKDITFNTYEKALRYVTDKFHDVFGLSDPDKLIPINKLWEKIDDQRKLYAAQQPLEQGKLWDDFMAKVDEIKKTTKNESEVYFRTRMARDEYVAARDAMNVRWRDELLKIYRDGMAEIYEADADILKSGLIYNPDYQYADELAKLNTKWDSADPDYFDVVGAGRNLPNKQPLTPDMTRAKELLAKIENALGDSDNATIDELEKLTGVKRPAPNPEGTGITDLTNNTEYNIWYEQVRSKLGAMIAGDVDEVKVAENKSLIGKILDALGTKNEGDITVENLRNKYKEYTVTWNNELNNISEAKKSIKIRKEQINSIKKKSNLTQQDKNAIENLNKYIAEAKNKLAAAEKAKADADNILKTLGQILDGGGVPVSNKKIPDWEVATKKIIDNLISGNIGELKISEHLPIPDVPNPTLYNAYQDTLSQFEKVINNVINKAKAIPPKPAMTLTPEQEKALAKYAKMMGNRMATARATSMEIANAARKFTLLDYRDKRGIDALNAYIFPYQYWYTRTWNNWLNPKTGRVYKNPHLVATYGRYREYMEKIHANMPEWYRYQVSSNELFGLNSENPLYFNLEATLNPLNGLLGVDFEDKRRRESVFGATVDSLGKFGPSVWTPLSLAVALDYWRQGNIESAQAMAGRLVPSTALVRGATSLMGVNQGKGLEIDPLMLLQGGLSVYDRNRVGRTLGQMEAAGKISHEQAVDAAFEQKGEVWDMAIQYMMNNPDNSPFTSRAFSQVLGGTLGVGFKGRSQEDALIDKAYTEVNALYYNKGNMSPTDYSMAWQKLYEQYPYLETVMLSRKSDAVREETYVWSILKRIPPGSQDRILEFAKLDPRLADKFYENKGLTKFSETDKAKFMASIRDIGLTLAVPDGTTSHEWAEAKARNKLLNGYLAEMFGENIQEGLDVYYGYVEDRDYSKSEQFLADNPQVAQYIQSRQNVILSDDLLNRYYGGIDFLENYYRGIFYRDVSDKLGSEIFNTVNNYYDIKEADGDTARYVRDHPELKAYWDARAAFNKSLEARISEAGNIFPDQPKPLIRSDAELNSIGAQDILKGISDIVPEAENAAVLAQYARQDYSSASGEYSITDQIEQVAEQRWPGILNKWEQFQRLSGSDVAAAQSFYNANPDLAAYDSYSKAMRNSYNNAIKGNFQKAEQYKQAAIMSQIDDTTMELIQMSAGNIPEVVRKYLEQIGIPLGMTWEEVYGYIQ